MVRYNSPGVGKGNLVKTFSNFGPDFTITFNMKITKLPFGWHNVLHLTTGLSCCEEGSRIPGLWLNSDSGKPFLHTDIGMTRPLQRLLKYTLEMNKQYHIELVLAAGIFTLRINGDEVWQVRAGIATYKDVKYYWSSPWVASAGEVAVLSMPNIQQGGLML